MGLFSPNRDVSWRNFAVHMQRLAPGVALCGLLSTVAIAIQYAEERAFQHPYIEALAVAIVLGIAVRSVWEIPDHWHSGIAFCAKQVLEIAIVLLGASISLAAIVVGGGPILGIVASIVILSLLASYGISRLLGLPERLSVLIASGNSICGNSAIVAVAPVIDASKEDVAAAISFTAILGALVVLGLPLLVPILQLNATQYGILAGLTVYAVPQVLAATVPVGLVSTQIAMVVKLTRVLMLGPLVIALSFLRYTKSTNSRRLRLSDIVTLVPWFIIGFIAMACLRSLNVIPHTAISWIQQIAFALTVLSMAALGLGVNLKVISTVGGRVIAAVTFSLLLLLGTSILVAQHF